MRPWGKFDLVPTYPLGPDRPRFHRPPEKPSCSACPSSRNAPTTAPNVIAAEGQINFDQNSVRVKTLDQTGGLIVCTPRGELAWAFNTRHMPHAWVDVEGREGVSLDEQMK